MRGWLRFDGLTGLALPMLVWAIHFVLVYIVAGLACARGWSTATVAGFTPASWGLLLSGLVAVVSLALIARRAWRDTPRPSLQGAVDAPPLPRRAFVARIVVALCLLSAIAIVFTTLPMLLLPTCD